MPLPDLSFGLPTKERTHSRVSRIRGISISQFPTTLAETAPGKNGGRPGVDPNNRRSSVLAVDSGERRLAAIVFADVVGYSAMMADDEDGTLSALRAHRNATDPVILNHGGRIVKGTGDGVLIEFPSAVEAHASCSPSRFTAPSQTSSSFARTSPWGTCDRA